MVGAWWGMKNYFYGVLVFGMKITLLLVDKGTVWPGLSFCVILVRARVWNDNKSKIFSVKLIHMEIISVK